MLAEQAQSAGHKMRDSDLRVDRTSIPIFDKTKTQVVFRVGRDRLPFGLAPYRF